jgi:hypothetical protein
LVLWENRVYKRYDRSTPLETKQKKQWLTISVKIDRENKKVIMDLPEGLIEMYL